MGRFKAIGVVLVSVAGLATVLLLTNLVGCTGGHVIPRSYVPNHQVDFDLADPPCDVEETRPSCSGVLVRYLGVGGVFIQWGDVSLLTAPHFTDYNPREVGFGMVHWDNEEIAEGLERLSPENLNAILVGHTHYDHFADVPIILLDHARKARVYVNQSGVHMLAAFPELQDRVVLLQDPGEDQEQATPQYGRWIWLTDADGQRLPVRFQPLASEHAPHFEGIHLADGKVDEPWGDWTEHRAGRMLEGTTFAFVIDLMSDDLESVQFRIHYQDHAGVPLHLVTDRPVDLAILTMPSSHLVENFPEGVLRTTRARYGLFIHFEDFLQSEQEPMRFVPTLTDKRAEQFLELADKELSRNAGKAGEQPDVSILQDCTCGPCGPRWAMPLPGEWLCFRPGD